MLDLMAAAFARAGLLRALNAVRPLMIDSTCFEERHRSGHYDRVCRKMKLRYGGKYAQKIDPAGVNASRASKARRMPKLSQAVASACHLVLAAARAPAPARTCLHSARCSTRPGGGRT